MCMYCKDYDTLSDEEKSVLLQFALVLRKLSPGTRSYTLGQTLGAAGVLPPGRAVSAVRDRQAFGLLDCNTEDEARVFEHFTRFLTGWRDVCAHGDHIRDAAANN